MVWTVNIFLGEKCVLTFCLGTYPCTYVIFFCPIAFAIKFLPLFVLLTPLSNWSLSHFLARCLSSLNLCWANHFSGSKMMKTAPLMLLSGHKPEQPWEHCVYYFTGILSQILGVSSTRLQGQPHKRSFTTGWAVTSFFLPVLLFPKINNRRGKSRQQEAKIQWELLLCWAVTLLEHSVSKIHTRHWGWVVAGLMPWDCNDFRPPVKCMKHKSLWIYNLFIVKREHFLSRRDTWVQNRSQKPRFSFKILALTILSSR